MSSRSGRLARRCAFAALVVVAATGCSNSSNKSAPASSDSTEAPTPSTTAQATSTTAPLPQACSLVTKAQADAAIGLTLQPPVAGGSGDQTSCTFTAPPTGPVGQVEVFAGPGAKTYLDTDQRIGHTFTRVSGLGDEATIEPGTIFFRKGTNWIAIRITSLDDSDAQVQNGVTALAHDADAVLSA